MRDVRLKGRTCAVLFASFANIAAAPSVPVLSSSGGVGDQNLQWANCSPHSAGSRTIIDVAASDITVAQGEQTVSMTMLSGLSSGSTREPEPERMEVPTNSLAALFSLQSAARKTIYGPSTQVAIDTRVRKVRL
jgi:hypothetical protein